MAGGQNSQARKLALRLTYIEGSFAALMVGTAETFAMFYAVKKGLSVSELGMLATLPIVLGAFAQWIVPAAVRFKDLKASILISILVQIFGLVALYLSVSSSHVFQGMFSALVLYWVGGMTAGPLWLDWVAAWMPNESFGRYISVRNGVMSAMTLIFYVVAAVALNRNPSPQAFAITFFLALCARIISFLLLIWQPSPSRPVFARKVPADSPAPSLFSSKILLIVLVITTIFKFAVNVSSPYFTPYMLSDLKLNLLQYVFITAIPFVGRSLYLARWGRAASSIRPVIGLQISMLGIALSPAFWTMTRSLTRLGAVETLSGMMWGGFDLCAVLIVQNFWQGSARKLLGAHLAFMSFASLAGAYVGSRLIESGWSIRDVFLLSSDLRLGTGILFILVVAGMRDSRTSLRVYGSFLTTVLTPRPAFEVIGRMIPARRLRQRRKNTNVAA